LTSSFRRFRHERERSSSFLVSALSWFVYPPEGEWQRNEHSLLTCLSRPFFSEGSSWLQFLRHYYVKRSLSASSTTPRPTDPPSGRSSSSRFRISRRPTPLKWMCSFVIRDGETTHSFSMTWVLSQRLVVLQDSRSLPRYLPGEPPRRSSWRAKLIHPETDPTTSFGS